MPFEICAVCHTGKVRRNNEDMFLVAQLCSRQDKYCLALDGRDFLLAAVADGMGGHADGEIASERVLQILTQFQREGRLPSSPKDHQVFCSLLADIHQKILLEQATVGGLRQMGATLVGAWFCPERQLVHFHAGDSRLYRWRDHHLDQLTRDHTVDNQMLREGADPGHVSRHLVTSCLGGGVNPPTVDTEVVPGSVLDGDRYLLCSDGLTDMLTHDLLTTLMAANNTAEQVTDSLLCAALEAGGQDNITAVVIHVLSDQAYDRDHR